MDITSIEVKVHMPCGAASPECEDEFWMGRLDDFIEAMAEGEGEITCGCCGSSWDVGDLMIIAQGVQPIPQNGGDW